MMLFPVMDTDDGHLRSRAVAEKLARFGFLPHASTDGTWTREGSAGLSFAEILAIFPQATLSMNDDDVPAMAAGKDADVAVDLTIIDSPLPADVERKLGAKAVAWPDFAPYGMEMKMLESGALVMTSSGPLASKARAHAAALASLGFVHDQQSNCWTKDPGNFVVDEFRKYFPDLTMHDMDLDGIVMEDTAPRLAMS
jgi:hypothetical protein